MNLSKEIAKHCRQVFFGGNWTDVNLKDTLAGITFEQAGLKYDSFNTIAALVFHINYFVEAVTGVLEGKPLTAHDKFSFDLQPLNSAADWESLKNKLFTNAESFASWVEKFPDAQLTDDFTDAKYGNYYRNFIGIIEHTHYHLGQIVIMKKMILNFNQK